MRKEKVLTPEVLVLSMLICLFIVFFILSYLSEGTYGGSDDYAHYKFARYALKYPYLFLNHWGKPAFTILSSPFAQLGFIGIKTFNLIVGLLAAYLSYRVCKIFNFKFTWLAIIFVFFAPVYLSMLLSGMTEILFSFVLILSVFLALRKNFLWSAIVLSFLPFVRNEGVVVFPFFLLYFLRYRKYWTLPLMLTGFIIFSIAGAWYYKDIFWVITHMPYTGAKDIYGSGPILYFVNATKSIFGIPMAIIGFVGTIVLCFELIKQKYYRSALNDSKTINELLLILGPFMAYYIMHSVLWWKGWGGSLGLIRVMAGIVPLLAILAVNGIDRTISLLPGKKVLGYIVVLALTYIIIVTPFKVIQIPVELGTAEKLIHEAGLWIHDHSLNKYRVYYYDPYYWFSLNIDPYDQNKTWETVPDREVPSRDMPENSVILWDSHYGPNEGKLKLEKLMNDTFLKLHKVFKPLQPFITLGGFNYEVCILQKTSNPNNIAIKWENYRKADSLNDVNFTKFVVYDFENDQPIFKDFKRSDAVAFTGRYSCVIDKNNEFGPTLHYSFDKLKKQQCVYKASVRLFAEDSVDWRSIFLVASADHKGKLFMYTTQNSQNDGKGWRIAKLKFELPKPKSAEDVLKIYIWNKEHQRFYVDDLEIDYK